MEVPPRHPLPNALSTACSRLLCLSASWFSFSCLLPLPQGFCTCHLFPLIELFFNPLLADLALSSRFPCLVKHLLLYHVSFFLHSSHLRFYLYLCDFINASFSNNVSLGVPSGELDPEKPDLSKVRTRSRLAGLCSMTHFKSLVL